MKCCLTLITIGPTKVVTKELKKVSGNNTRHNGEVPGAKLQPVSPYHVGIVFPPRLHCYSVALAPLGFWIKEPWASME
jgi:hypothetical protein